MKAFRQALLSDARPILTEIQVLFLLGCNVAIPWKGTTAYDRECVENTVLLLIVVQTIAYVTTVCD
jgi:hypothetical protein